MMILFLIITAALTLYAAFHIVAPFFQSREEQLRFEVLDEDLRHIEELVAQRSYLLQSLRELQLDHETGKIPEDDYESTRKKLELEAVKVLRELDEVHGGRGWQETIDEELSERVQGIRKRRQDTRSTDEPEEPRSTGDAEALEQRDSEDVEASQTIQQISCPDCGKTMEPDARFCSQCGHAFDDGTEDEPGEATASASDATGVDDLVTEQSTDVADTSAEVVR
jgi:hypothetical protein